MTSQETDNDDFTAIKSRGKYLAEHGYNIIPILPEGTKYPHKEKGSTTSHIKIADGKKAEGLPSWSKWEKEKQPPNFVDEFDQMLIKFNNKLSNYFTSEEMTSNKLKTFNLAVICGDYNDGDYSFGTIDIDGNAKSLYDEALILLESENEELAQKLKDTLICQSRSGGFHVDFWYDKKGLKGLRKQDIYTGNNEHEEIKILLNGNYSIVGPSEGYKAINDDIEKVAKLSKKEYELLVKCMKIVQKEQEPPKEKQKHWTDNNSNQGNNYQENCKDDFSNVDALIKLAKPIYQEPTRHDFALYYGACMRRYLFMTEKPIAEVIEALHPNDAGNKQVVRDIFSKPVNEMASRSTLKSLILKITKDERKTSNIMREFMSYGPADKGVNIDDDKEPEGAELLFFLADTKAELFFKDTSDNYYVMIYNEDVDSHEIINIDTEEYQQMLGVWYKDECGKFAANEWKKQAIDYFKGKVNEMAKVDSYRFIKELYINDALIKTADGYEFYHNLNNEKGEIYKITKHGHGIVKQSPDLILFQKLPYECAVVYPDFNNNTDNRDNNDSQNNDSQNNNINYLEKWLRGFNYELADINDSLDDHILLLQCYHLVTILGTAAIPIHLITGAEGSGKSALGAQTTSLKTSKEGSNDKEATLSLTNMLDLIPDHVWERTLVIHQSSYTCHDNIGEIPKPVFEELCLNVTGYDLHKRIHHTMIDMMTLKGKRPLAITSIHVPTTKRDFMDRVLHTKLAQPTIYKSDEQLWQEFFEMKPKIMGFIFTKIQEFLGKYEELQYKIVPKTRLGQFEIQCEIMSRVLGNEEGKFQKIWSAKRIQQVETAMEDDGLAQGFFRYLKSVRNQNNNYVAKNTTSDILAFILKDTAFMKRYVSEDDKIGWWRNERALGAALNNREGQFKKVGIDYKGKEKIGNDHCRVYDFSTWANGKDGDYWKDDFQLHADRELASYDDAVK